MMLEVRALRAGYGAVEVLHGVDLEVAEGEVVALLGSNGAGKSTLNNNVSGIYRPFAGSITFTGEPIAGAAPARIVELGRSELWTASLASAVACVGYGLILKALETAPASYVVAARQSSVIFAVVMSVVQLRERPGRSRVVGAAATVLGVFLIARFGG